MIRYTKTQLLLAAATSSLVATAAQAQVAFPAADIHGAGSSAVAVVLPREQGCLTGAASVKNGSVLTYSNTSTTPSANPPGLYQGTDATFDCSVTGIQPKITAKYLSTGSGDGKKYFATGTLPSGTNPWGAGWTTGGPHYSMSDSSVSDRLSAYNAGRGVQGGPLIQIPLYVLPVALAYNPVYGIKYSGGAPVATYKFNVATPQSVYNTLSGGMRLSKAAYCGIFNGTITNFNDPVLTALNTYVVGRSIRKKLLKSPADSLARWEKDGVPIRLVGRLDKSGTTDIFTRHLAAACNAANGYTGTNYFAQAAEALPYDPSTATFDLTSGVNSSASSPYYPNNSATAGLTLPNGTKFAGTVTRLSGATSDGASIDTSRGAEAPGLFLVAAGSGRVAGAINIAPDKPSASAPSVKLNGKLGYIGADWVKPSAGQTLFAAALKSKDSSGKAIWALPLATLAVAAFGTTIRPPQSDGRGNFLATGFGDRASPEDWYNALYQTGNLASPSTGYPLTGTTQMNLATCYSNPAIRNALATFISETFGLLTKTSKGVALNPNLLNGTENGKVGIKTQTGIATMPKAWIQAVRETFLSVSLNTTLKSKQLWLQNGLPTTAVAGVATLPTSGAPDASGKFAVAAPNPSCGSGAGKFVGLD